MLYTTTASSLSAKMGSLALNNLNNDKSTNISNETKKQKSIHYQLFMYNEELRRRNTRQIRIAKSKISLTDTLITQNVQHLHDATLEDLHIISREMSFKQHLQKQVSRISRLAALGINVNSMNLQNSLTTSSL